MLADDWRHFAKMDRKVADFAIIATPDKLHKDPAVALAKLGNAKIINFFKIFGLLIDLLICSSCCFFGFQNTADLTRPVSGI